MRIAFVASEAVPYAKTGGLADVAGALTKELARKGHDTALFLPAYRGVADKLTAPKKVATGINISVGMDGRALDVIRSDQDGVSVFGLVNEHFFDRPELYRDPRTGQDWADNDERFIFFSEGVLAVCEALGWFPEIVHANDWQSALIPTLLNTRRSDDPRWSRTRSLFTVHNIAYQGMFGADTFAKLGLDDSYWFPGGPFEYWGKVNFLKLGLEFAETLSTVSGRYAQEIAASNEYGFGMEGILARRQDDLYGIVNGIDYDIWNPETDEHIARNYTAASRKGKAACKRDLQQEVGLPESDAPLIGIVSRLADQKGFDLINEVSAQLMRRDLQIVLLGTGDARYHELFASLAERHPDRLAAALRFDNGLAHRIEAGSDMFLMPSRYEPCGLNQLYSLRYGTIPIVRDTGGLADTVEPLRGNTGTGFLFEEYSGSAMLGAVDDALAAYRQPKVWAGLVQRAMAADFSWPAATEQYENLYRKTASKPRRTPSSTPAV